MLYEDTPQGRKLLVAYNEGRFAKNGRYIVLPKGEIDAGETVFMGGLREFGEETGFPLIDCKVRGISGFLNVEQTAALERGETLHHVTNPRFPGIEIIKFEPIAYPHKYHARSGKIHRMVMFGVEVRGIDAIAAHPLLKNREGKTTKDFLDGNREIPRFPQLLDWMRQGRIPADGKLPEVMLHDPKWFAKKMRKYNHGGNELASHEDFNFDEMRQQWQRFCVRMEKDEDYPLLRASFGKIKQRMLDKGFAQGDNAVLKFDEKDCPLFWYTEGAMAGLARPILTKVLTDVVRNSDYARAHGGRGTKFIDLRKDQEMSLGQIAGFSPFVSKEDWRSAAEDVGLKPRVAHMLVRTGHRMRVSAVTPSPARA
jgi:8-oxo-dGTP pyrophosphatase MutT (NUDIX family)